MAMIDNDWLPVLAPEFKKPYYAKLYEFVKEEYHTHVVYPPSEDIFNAFHFTPLKDVKVLILGQDPYHEEHQAQGMCFSVEPSQEIPPSLVNIYKELQDDLGCYIPNNGYLKKWADQGVLLLNTVLTIRQIPIREKAGKCLRMLSFRRSMNRIDRLSISFGADRRRRRFRCSPIRSIWY